MINPHCEHSARLAEIEEKTVPYEPAERNGLEKVMQQNLERRPVNHKSAHHPYPHYHGVLNEQCNDV